MCVNPPAVETFPMQELQELQRSFCLTRGWGKSHGLLELLEEFHKLKAVTSKQLTSATNPSEKILSKCWLSILSCGYLKSTQQRVCTQRAKHTVTIAQPEEKHFQRRAEGILCSGISLFCLTSPSVPHTFLNHKPSQLSLLIYFLQHGI